MADWIITPGARPADNVQQLTVAATSGNFTLSFENATATVSVGSTAATVQSDLQALSTIGAGGVVVAGGPTGQNNENTSAPYIITFLGGLAAQTEPLLVVGGTATTTQSITTNYDASGDVTNTAESNPATSGGPIAQYAYSYDGQGNVASVDNTGTAGVPHVVLSSEYDALGNRTQLAATIAGTADFINNYSYDALSRLFTETQQNQTGGNAVAPKGVQFGYNAIDELTSLQRYTNLVSGPNPNGDVGDTTLTYNTLGQVTDITHVHGTTSIDNSSYAYDALARVSTFGTSADGTATYGYDPTDQVTSASYTGGTHTPANENYSFDKNGNRTTVNGTATTVSAGNEVTNDGTNRYSFDLEGNRVSETNIASGDVTSFTWDSRNRLVEVEMFNASGTLTEAVAFAYDMYDRMIEREVDTNGATSGGLPVYNVVQNYVYDGADPVLEFVNGSLANRFLNGPGPSGVDMVMAAEAVTSLTQPGSVSWPTATCSTASAT